jgi:leucyl-tRNA synthetase
MSYPHHELETRWQQKWAEADCFAAKLDTSKPKFYALDMFPYPSGAGLHVGHLASYTPTDIVSRYKRAKGFNVLHPMGYDAFGLPAEQYAIQTGIHPAITTNKAIENFRKTLKSYGYSFDWNREVSTCDPSYYKWTQFIFLKLYEKGLAYQKEAPVNWCPALRTVLANEEVVDGKSERGGHPVIRKKMRQWMLKITAYAERLLEGLDKVDWNEATKDGQRNWIGKSVGAEVKFKVSGDRDELVVFTTRPDTIFGVTFMVVAPEHPLLKKLTTSAQKKAVDAYLEEVSRKSDLERKVATEKTGVFTGSFAVNPLSDEKIPIWVADYVLMDYGTGAIMAVPGHDTRDFEFAQQFKLEVKRVLESSSDLPFEGDGKLVNSGFLNGLEKNQAILKAIKLIEEKGLGEGRTQYKLRDWLFSRQRYWGEPIPVVHKPDGTTVGLSYDELPLTLPEVADYEPSEQGEPPLARVENWVNYKGGGTRVTDTMPGSAGSSWYFLRYTDPLNSSEPFSFEAQKYWMPVDLYIGGTEHTVGHLLYSRFWHKVLFDCGLVSSDEPFQKLRHQGVIMGADGHRMSKSRGNVVNPDDMREAYGVDATRMYVSFMGPFDKDKPWDTKGIEGVRRFLERVWRLAFDETGKVVAEDVALPADLEKTLHKTIKKVGGDIENMGFNTAVSQMMILVNEVYRHNLKPKAVLKILAQLLQPFAPHFAEEIWQHMGGKGLVCLAPWPVYDEKLTIDDTAEMGVQVNGKMRGTIQISLTASEKEALELAMQVNSVANALQNMAITKVIFKPGKILNLIAK